MLNAVETARYLIERYDFEGTVEDVIQEIDDARIVTTARICISSRAQRHCSSGSRNCIFLPLLAD
ncbi:MAG: hypothetical protein IJP62_05515 [Treponema sp.]|nr:hypothetical protein [Treponema sp.]